MIGNIFIVDDDLFALALLEEVLQADGHVVHLFDKSERALQSLASKEPDLILLDILMSDMDGFEVCRRVKQDQRFKEIPVIFISAVSDREDKARAFRVGGADYITKPFQKEEVIARVRTHIALSHAIQRKKKTTDALRVSEERLTMAQSVVQTGSWHLDITTNRLEWTPESFRIFGIPERDAVDLDTFFSAIHPDDREMVRKFWNEAIAGAPYDIEHRVVAGGEVRWVRERAVVERDSAGRAISGIGTTQDITERKQADMEIRRLEKEYRSLVENLPDIIYRFDRELRSIYVNQAMMHLTGMNQSSLLGKTLQEQGLPKLIKDTNTNALERVLATGVPELVESQYLGVDGVVRHYHTRVVPEFGASGEVETILTISRDISKLKSVEMILRESEERLHAISSNIPGMVFQCCRRAGESRLWFTYVSNGAKDLLNMDATEILLDENRFIGCIAQEYARSFYDSLAQSQSELTLWNWEGRVTAADGSVKWVNLRATPHPQGEDMCIWNGVVINVTESKINESKLIHSQQILRELASHLESVREEERKHVAREIHDEMGQTLTALKMDISLARISFGGSNPQLMERLQSMTKLMDRTLEIARHITSSLRPGALDLGIIAAIEWLVEEFTGYTGLPCELVLGDGDITLDEPAATAVFRIVQESLTNIARHSGATQAEIIVTRTDESLFFEVRDNGKGFDPHSVASHKSFGLTGMRERITMLQGDLTLDSELGRGAHVRVRIPVTS